MLKKKTSEDAGALDPIPDPLHDIDLKHGTFDKTSPDGLEQAFAKLLDLKSTDLCVFFHGGLVSRADALKTAGDLIQGYTQSGAYPMFFIWNSDLLTQIEGRLKRYQDDPAFIEAANLGVSTVARKIEVALGKGRARAALSRRRPARGQRLDLKTLSKLAKPYDRAWSRAPGLQLSVTQSDLDAFQAALLRIKRARERRRGLRIRGLFPVGRIRGAGNPIARILQRFNSKHDHGLYTTVIEEICIAIGIADFAKGLLDRMKTDIDLAFDADPRAGGTVFLEKLKNAWTKLPNLRVTLIGHSAGAIYVQRFIEALDVSFGPQQTVEVITLAAAMSFERMFQGLAVLQRRVSAVRVFGLSDRREGGYWEVPFIYDKSLLYIVTSLCEGDPDADKPLLGMQRYWRGSKPYNQPYINAITQFITRKGAAVWSPTSKTAKPGYRSNAKRHAGRPDGFPEEDKTTKSVCYALQNGLMPSTRAR
jgi:hypothetical protein